MRVQLSALATLAMAAITAPTWAASNPVLQHSLDAELAFEKNVGQAAAHTDFVVRGAGHSIEISPRETVLRLKHRSASDKSHPVTTVRTELVGANPDASGSASGKLDSYSNYIYGSDPKSWRTHVAQYQRVEFDEVYPGIDLAYYGKGRELEYDFIVEPGADVSQIQLKVKGAESVRLDRDGNLVLKVDGGELIQRAPIAFQEVGTKKVPVAAAFKLDVHTQQVTMQVGAYDAQRTLIIDPVLSYATYFGGPGTEETAEVTADSTGAPIFVGYTTSTIPATPGSAQPSSGDDAEFGGTDAFITKLTPAGNAVAWSTYLGGVGLDEASAVAVAANNDVIVAGTSDGFFPVSAGAQMTAGGGGDAFVARLSANGASLQWATYLGGPQNETVSGVAVDAAGSVFVAGNGYEDFPTVNGYLMLAPGAGDGFVAKLSSTGNSVVWATYIGGPEFDILAGLDLDPSGNPVVAGTTDGTYPTFAGYQMAYGGGVSDVFVTKLNATGTAPIWSTYFGGFRREEAADVAVDKDGNVAFVGFTDGGFPVRNATQSTYGGAIDGFVARLSGDGLTRQFASYIGGNTADRATGVTTDISSNIFVSGYTAGNFPLKNAVQGAYGGGSSDGFIVKVTTVGSFALDWSTYLGGTGTDFLDDVAWSPLGDKSEIYAVGQANAGFPTMMALQTVVAGDYDAILARLEEDLLPPTVAISVTPVTIFQGQSATISWSSQNAGSCEASGAWTGAKSTFGTQTVAPTEVGTYTYTLSCLGANGSVNNSTTLTVNVPPPKPTVTITATPSLVNISQGTTLSWSSTDATNCIASGDWSGSRGISGALTLSYSTEGVRTFNLNCTGPGGSTIGSTTVTVQKIPPTINISANPPTIAIGESSSVVWSTTFAQNCTATGNWSGNKATSGSQAFTPAAVGTYSYTLSCAGTGGSSVQTATLIVTDKAPTVSLSIAPTSVVRGSSATLSWSSTNATSCTATGEWTGSKATSGSESVTPTTDGTKVYSLTCTGTGGSVTQTASLTVTTPAPVIDFTANPPAIKTGSASTLNWAVQNADSCIASGAWTGDKPVTGSQSVVPAEAGSYTYTLSCTGAGGATSRSATVTVTDPIPTPELDLSISPGSILRGASSNLLWTSRNTTACVASGSWTGDKALSGSLTLSPPAVGTYTYSMTCSGDGGSITKSATLEVTTPPPTLELTLNPTRVIVGGTAFLAWVSTDANECVASGAWDGARDPNGSSTVSPTTPGNYTYTLSCTGDGGSITRSVGLEVVYPSPTVDLTANPVTLEQGEASMLTWSSTDTDSCTASGSWDGSKGVTGGESVVPPTTGNHTYTITCAGKDGTSVADSVTVYLKPPKPAVTITSAPTTMLIGSTSTLTWNSSNASECVASDAWTGVKTTSGTQPVTPASPGSYLYTITCTGESGSATASAAVTVTAPEPTLTLAIDRASIITGETANLTWSTTNADNCTASGAWGGTKVVNGSQSVSPVDTGVYTYSLTCSSAGGDVTRAVNLQVNPPPDPTLDITSDRGSMTAGETAVLTWTSTNSTSCTASGAWTGSKAVTGSQPVSPASAGTYTYTLSCSGAGGNISRAVSIVVNPKPEPTLEFTGSPLTYALGGQTVLSWTSANTTSCSASGSWTGSKSLTGNEAVTPTSTGAKVYSLTCVGDGGSITRTVNVTVAAPAPSLDLTVSPQSITRGSSASLSWTSTNVASCVASGSWTGSKSSSGNQSVTPSAEGSYTYTLTCTGDDSSTIADTVTLTVNAPEPVISLAVSPTSILKGETANLTWSSTDATSCDGSGSWTGVKATSGSQSLTPPTTGNFTYTLSCTGPSGSASKSVTLSVTAPRPTVDLTVAPGTITQGGSATVGWTSTEATSCSATGAWTGSKGLNGSQSVSPATAGSYTYTLTCTGDGGTATDSDTLTVSAAPGPTLTFTGTPTSYVLGGSTGLTWSSTNATDCTASGEWSGVKALSGSQSVTPTSTGAKLYTLTCTGLGGSITRNVNVTVNPPPVPTVNLSVAPTTIYSDESAGLTWTSSGADNCVASGAWTGTKALSGTQTVTPGAVGTFTYTLACTNAGGTTTRSATLTANPFPAPTVTFAATPSPIYPDQSSSLNWSTSNATSCTASGGWTGAKATSGTQSVAPGAVGSYSYTLACTGRGGTTSRTASLTVQPYPPPTVTLTANPANIRLLGLQVSSTLSWTTTNATSCVASNAWTGTKAVPSGTQAVLTSIAGVRTYTLTCTGKGGTASASATITSTLL